MINRNYLLPVFAMLIFCLFNLPTLDAQERQSRQTDDSTIGRYQRYVDSLMKTYDKDGSNTLDKKELNEMRRKPPVAADTNSDGVVSRGELLDSVMGVTSKAKSSQSQSEKQAEVMRALMANSKGGVMMGNMRGGGAGSIGGLMSASKAKSRSNDSIEVEMEIIMMVVKSSDINRTNIKSLKGKSKDEVMETLKSLGSDRPIDSLAFSSSVGRKTQWSCGSSSPQVVGIQSSRSGRSRSINYNDLGTIISVTPEMKNDHLRLKLDIEKSVQVKSNVKINEPDDGDDVFAFETLQLNFNSTVDCKDGGSISTMSDSGNRWIIAVFAAVEE